MNQKKMLDALTSLRFFAAAMIVLTHGHPLFGSFGIANAAPLGQGVSFFFVLSGFILTYNYPSFETREQFQNFFVARFARIWPLHLVTCLIWIGLIFKFDRQVYFPGVHGAVRLLANLLMVQSWVPLKGWALSFNGVAWSISVEFFFYLCFPLLVVAWRRYWHVLLTASAAIVYVTFLVCNKLQLPQGDDYQGVGLLGVIYFGPTVRLLEFMVGIGVANVLRDARTIDLTQGQWLLIEVGAILAIVSGMLFMANPIGIKPLFGEAGAYYFQREGLWLFWALLIGVFATSTGPIYRLLSTRPFVFLGEISFALYLVHAIIITYIELYMPGAKGSGMKGGLTFWAVCLTLAALLFVGVERPCRGMILGWWSKRKYGAPKRRLHPFGRLELSSLALLFASCAAMYVFRPTIGG